MKKLSILLVGLFSLLLVSCDKTDNNGHELITFGQAFQYCLHNMLYVVPAIFGILLFAAYNYYVFALLPKRSDITTGHIVAYVIVLALMVALIVVMPNDMHLNTTVEAAKRGHMI